MDPGTRSGPPNYSIPRTARGARRKMWSRNLRRCSWTSREGLGIERSRPQARLSRNRMVSCQEAACATVLHGSGRYAPVEEPCSATRPARPCARSSTPSALRAPTKKSASSPHPGSGHRSRGRWQRHHLLRQQLPRAGRQRGLAGSPRHPGQVRLGHGVGAVHLRDLDLHKELEDAISTFHKTEDTILYAACFDANGGLFEPLLTAEDAIVSDQLNHASIIDGVRLVRGQALSLPP